eukprot:Hpha_TRINITY_DN5210_c0_g1::TRINITY_DN5210_c0_g1_i1::g.116514::m.116514/K12850/PRPF38B; pre-mRNA-splicing factor 38B
MLAPPNPAGLPAATVGGPVEEEAALPTWSGCNAQMNLETALHQRITEHTFYRDLCVEAQTTGALLEVANRWDFPRDLAAWVVQEHDAGQPTQAQARNRQTSTVMVQGGVRGRDTPIHHGLQPSHAWCLLLRLFHIRPRRSELEEMFSRNAKAHVRCLAVLYVRLTQPPSELLEWLAPALEDVEATVSVSTGKVTLREFTRCCVMEQKAVSTMLPRVPERVLRQFRRHLGEATQQDIEAEQREAAARERQEKQTQEEEAARLKRKREADDQTSKATPLPDPSAAPNEAERRRLERLRRKKLAEQ